MEEEICHQTRGNLLQNSPKEEDKIYPLQNSLQMEEEKSAPKFTQGGENDVGMRNEEEEPLFIPNFCLSE